METHAKNGKIITKYKQYLKLEKSFSSNTIDAYLTDLDKLMAYLTLEEKDCLDVTLDDLEAFSAGLHDIGINPRSQARILSGVRAFYRFLLLEDYIRQDPSELLESPQIGQHLPDILTVEEIDRLIGSIDRSSREGQRNRAILETLYSCGLRFPNSATSDYRTCIWTKASSKWKAKAANSDWFPFLPELSAN